MNIPPLPPITAASIAGTQLAANAHVANSHAAESSTTNSSIKQAETVDRIDKGTASGDSEADGRQMLDTFERRKRDDEPQDESIQPKVVVTDEPKANAEGHTRIDFIA